MVTYSVRVKITGMTCNHCVNTITKALQEFEGISSSTVEVSLENFEATFKFEEVDPTRTRAQLQHTLAEAIEDLGYDAGTPELISSDSPETALSLGTPNKDTSLHATIPISGMTCSHCTNTVTKALQALPSIDPESIQVSLEDETAKMTFRNPIDDTITEEKLKEIIEDLGYDVGEINLVTQASNQQQVKAIDINNNSKINSSDNVTTVVFSLSGMTCQHCVKSVSDTLRNLRGVLPSTVLVSLEKRQGCFSFEGSSVDAHKVKEVIEDLGYDLNGKPRFSIGARPNSLEFMPSFNSQTAISMDENSPLFPSSYQSAQGKRRKVVMRVLGMTCHSCVASVTDALMHEIPNVEPDSVHVNLQAEMAMFICTDPNIDLIYCVVGDRGFDIENVQIIHNLIPPSVVLASSSDDQGAVSQQQERKRQNSLVSSLGAVSIDSRQSVFVPHKVTFQISGMTCASCVRTIEKGLVNLPSVDPTSVQVNLLTQTGTLSVFRGDILDEQAIINAVKKMGYTASKVIFIASQQPPSTSQQQVGATFKAELIIPDMHCPKCVEKVHSALIKLHGIRSQSIQVELDSCRARFEFTGEFITRQRIYQSIRDFGLSADSIKISKIHKEEDDTASLSPSIKSDNKDQFAPTHLVVTGMTCASCVANIERTMMKQPGVVSCHVNLLAKSAVIEHDPSLVGARSLAQMIEQIGYKAELAQESGFTISEQRASMRESLDKELAVLRSRFLWSLLFAVPVVLIAMIFMMALPMSHPIRQFFMREIVHGLSISDLILFLLATPVQFWLGMPFYVKAYKSLVYSRTANMETLVAMGTTVAYVASVASVIATMARPMAGAMSMNYFETAVLLITFIHFGKWLEAMAKGKTAETITKLMDLQPEKATLVEISKNTRQSVDVSTSSSSSSGKTNVEENEDTLIEREIDSKDIQVGDILKINAGGRIPCDGKVWRGSSAADESMITGESVPVTKKKGDSVITATINLSAPIYIRAIRVGSDTTLSRIIQLVQDAQASPKAPIEQLADNISSVFVPVVILLALVTFIVWEVLSMKDLYPDDWVPMGENKTIFSLMLAVTVLVIACPCGLGLASPTAVMVGTGVAAKYGVLVKGGGYALEMANRITTVAFDKTGTLTMGKPIVTHSWIDLAAPATSTKEQDDAKTNSAQKRMAIWKILGRVSSASNHPLSKSIEKKARYIIQALAKNPKLSDSELILNSVEAEAVEDEHFDDLPVAQRTSAEDLFDGVTITNAQEVPGRGLLATITLTKEISDHLAGKLCHVRALNVFLGNQEWMDENHAVHQTSRQTKECHKLVTDWQNLGQSIVLVAASPVAGQNEEQDSAKDLHKDGCKNACACDVCNCASNSICCTASKTLKIAQLAIADIPRPEATALIAELRKREIEVWMITGDNERTGRVIGKQLGIPAEYVLAGVKPEQKSDKIRNLQRRGIRITKEYHDGENKFWKRRKSNGDKFRDTAVVAMVGDGINDSPALAQADVGISVGSATDIAIEAASIVLIRNNLMDLLTMYDISRTVVRRIRFNFLWAFLYNAIAIPIAAGILYPATGQGLPPYIAGIAMVASSVSVVCSSLLLRLYKAPKIVEDSHRIKL